MAIVAALLVALLGAAGVVLYAQNADARAVAGQATQQVFIAQAPVPQGTSARDALAQKLIVAQTVVSRGVPAGALTEVSGATASLVATTPIAPRRDRAGLALRPAHQAARADRPGA